MIARIAEKNREGQGPKRKSESTERSKVEEQANGIVAAVAEALKAAGEWGKKSTHRERKQIDQGRRR